ncbi:MAG: DUF3343 domain-containing protein [Phycisphaerales bacterium]|nr:MAG: DUF3343 domain-containing protein [Phycisphaerales bacterium]
MADYAVILVHSTSHAIHAERVLKRADLQAKLVPTPRHLSSDCGTAIRIAAADHADATVALEQSGVDIDRIERLEV